ncbi:MAG: terminase small subunit [Proteobacteria bacterium]|nr:terminase small subunit [Pseudomonadota bacterium]
MKLTAKQSRFVAEYIKSLNGTQSAVAAGYSSKTARSIASELLGKPQIKAEIARQDRQRQKQFRVQQKYVLQELVKIANFDISRLYDERNRPLPPRQWPADALNVVKSFKANPLRGAPAGSLSYSIEYFDRLKVWERIGEIVGEFSPKRTNKRRQ